MEDAVRRPRRDEPVERGRVWSFFDISDAITIVAKRRTTSACGYGGRRCKGEQNVCHGLAPKHWRSGSDREYLSLRNLVTCQCVTAFATTLNGNDMEVAGLLMDC